MKNKEYKKRNECAVCKSEKLDKILDLGSVPLAGYFPKENDNNKTYELNLMVCKKCGLVQTDSLIEPDTLFKDYRYSSSVSLSGHFTEVAKMLTDKFSLNQGKKVLEIGCNDGVLMEPLSKLGVYVVGIDPAENIVATARAKLLSVYCDYFNLDFAKKHSDSFKEGFDLIVANNTFAHVSNIRKVLKGIEYSLAPDGTFVFEVHYLKSLIELKQWDNIYHEHIYYYSVTAVENFMRKYDMKLVDFEEIPIHSGSIRFYAQKIKDLKDKFIIPTKVANRIKEEQQLYDNLKNFSDETYSHIDTIRSFVQGVKNEGKTIIGYGSSGRANMFCNIVGLTNKDIDYIVDESPERFGRFIPSMNIPIISRQEMDQRLVEKPVDYIFIFAWNYSHMIMEKLKDRGFKYIVAFPELQVVSNYDELKNKTGL